MKKLTGVSLMLLLIHFVVLGSNIQKVDGSSATVEELDKTIPIVMKKAGVPGLSIAVFNQGEFVYHRVFGVKSTATLEPVRKNTLFEAASLTKPVTAYIALRLVDQGKLELDKPLYHYLEYKDISHDERYKLITARIVLKHATGFPNWRSMNKDKKLDIKFTPGEKFSYSGEGYVYLQRVMQKITGQNLEELAKVHVFTPLGMRNSSLILPDSKRAAQGHNNALKPRKKGTTTRANGAASLHTTAKDYALFLIAVAKGKGLSKPMAQQMLKPQITYSKEIPSLTWGLGLGLYTGGADTYFWHWGDNGVFKAFAMASKNKNTGVVYFANSSSGLGMMRKITGLTIGGAYPMFPLLGYPQYDGPSVVIGKLIEKKGLDAGLKKYHEWKAKDPQWFKEPLLNSMGYYLLGKKKIKEAVEIFKMNVKAYPQSFNVYDSLGEAYMINGDKELAIKNYRKSVKLNPDNRGGIEALKKLEGQKK
jgi:CubicO group peptidase (beta-lactamase class C family)